MSEKRSRAGEEREPPPEWEYGPLGTCVSPSPCCALEAGWWFALSLNGVHWAGPLLSSTFCILLKIHSQGTRVDGVQAGPLAAGGSLITVDPWSLSEDLHLHSQL